MPTVRCPGCDDAIEIEADWYGRTVACPTCDRRFTPRRPGRDRDDEDDDRRERGATPPEPPTRRRYRADDEDDDRRPSRRRRPAPKSGGRGTWLVLGILGGVLALGCLGCGGWGVWSFTAPIDYSAPWVTQSTPDGTCSIQFPRTPRSESVGDALGGTTGTKWSLIETWPPDAGFAFGYIDFPFDQPGLFDEAWRLELAELTRGTGASVKRETTTTVAGHPCKEAELTVGGSRGTYRLINLTGRPRPRLLVVFVGGRNVSDADQKKFLDSLRVNGK